MVPRDVAPAPTGGRLKARGRQTPTGGHHGQDEEGDLIASRWTATMTHQGDDLGVPASGRQVTVHGMSMARLKDGRMVEGWNNWDTLEMMQQIGAFQPVVTLVPEP